MTNMHKPKPWRAAQRNDNRVRNSVQAGVCGGQGLVDLCPALVVKIDVSSPASLGFQSRRASPSSRVEICWD